MDATRRESIGNRVFAALRRFSRVPARSGLGLGLILLTRQSAFAQDGLDKADTAWMMSATLLVLMMTVPGLALFYGGMVRKTNTLSIIMQSFAVACLVTLLWVLAGYSLAFSEGGSFVGDFAKSLFLSNLSATAMAGTIPESVFLFFQMTFAIITPALVTGAFADRMRFGPMLVLLGLWSLLVYAPLAHMVWAPQGWMFNWGVLDFAGGTVVHIASGVTGLVFVLLLGPRRGFGRVAFMPHNLVYSVTGAGLLWVGWFGFNAGSALTAGTGAAMAMLVTQIAAAAGAMAWLAVEWALRRHASVLGIISGAIAGLVAITPAAGFVDARAALIIGLLAGAACFFASSTLKNRLGYDDALDAFGIHGIGGILGALLTGVFATQAVKGGDAPVGLIDGRAEQVWIQLVGIGATIAYVGLASAILFLIVNRILKLRVAPEVERDGLDLALHGEAVQ